MGILGPMYYRVRGPRLCLCYNNANMPDNVAFPLTAIVGQEEMKDALLLAAVNPRVHGVSLIGAKGTGKTTAARGLLPLLPTVEHSTCPFGCGPSWR